MKVLMLINGRGLCGGKNNSFIFVEQQIDSLTKLDITVHRFYCGSGASLVDLVRNLPHMIRIIRKFKPDILHAQYGSMTAFEGLLGKLLFRRTRLIVSFCGSDLMGHNKKNGKISFRSRIGIFVGKIVAYFANGIIVKSRGLYELIPYRCRGKTEIIPNGVNLELFRPIDYRSARRDLGISEQKKIVLFNEGNNPYCKGYDLAKKAIEINDGNIRLLTIGNVPFDKMPLYLSAADVLLVVSRHEGSPNIVKEALACNLPIVSVDCGDVQERINGVWPSFLVSRDPQDISECITKVININQRSNGREKIKSLSIENVALKINQLYCKIL